MTEINTRTAVMMESEPTEERTRTNAIQFELTQQLSRKMHITLEKAKAALEVSGWNMLTATYLLEQEEFRQKQMLNEVAATEAPDEEPRHDQSISEAHTTEKAEEGIEMKENGLKKVGRAIMNLIAIGNRNRFAIHKGGEQLLEMPVTVLALLLLFSFGTRVPVGRRPVRGLPVFHQRERLQNRRSIAPQRHFISPCRQLSGYRLWGTQLCDRIQSSADKEMIPVKGGR